MKPIDHTLAEMKRAADRMRHYHDAAPSVSDLETWCVDLAFHLESFCPHRIDAVLLDARCEGTFCPHSFQEADDTARVTPQGQAEQPKLSTKEIDARCSQPLITVQEWATRRKRLAQATPSQGTVRCAQGQSLHAPSDSQNSPVTQTPPHAPRCPQLDPRESELTARFKEQETLCLPKGRLFAPQGAGNELHASYVSKLFSCL